MIRFFLQRPMLVHVITIAVLAIGILVLSRSQREGFPAVTINEVVITTVLPGASPDDVEAQITVPIEDAIREVDGVEETSSTSQDGLSQIVVSLYEDLGPREVEAAERDLQKAVDAITDFPDDLDAPPVLTRFNPAKRPVIEIGLTGPPAALREATELLRPRIEELGGVGEVSEVGLGDREIEVLLDPVRARAQQVTLDEVMAALQRRNVASTGGRLTAYPLHRQVVLSGEYRDVEEIRESILRFHPTGGALRLRDVAMVRETVEDTGLRVHAEGEPAVSLIVRKRESADILDTVDAIYALIDAAALPEGVQAHIYNDVSRETRNRLDVVITNGVGGVVLVLAVLLIFLSARVSFWVAFGLPFALLGVTALLPALGISINMISLAGFVLVIGIVVDDAIIIAERIAFHLEAGLPPVDAAVTGTREMAVPVIGSSLTTILAFSPLFLLGGLPGKFSWAIPAIVIMTLAVSLFECFFILPGHIVGKGEGAKTLDKPKARFMVALERGYSALLRKILPRGGLIALLFLLLFVGTLQYLRTSMPVVLFPQDDSDTFYIKVNAPLGTPIERTEAIVRDLERQLPAIVGEDLQGVTARVGHQEILQLEREIGAAEHEAHVSVYLRNEPSYSAHAWISRVKRELQVPAAVEVLYEAKVIGPPMGKPVQVHVSSNDDAQRRRVSNQVRAYLGGLPGVAELESDARPGIRQIDLRLDYRRLALEQVSVDTVSRTVKAAFFGLPITELRDLDERVDIRVRFDPAARADLDMLLATPVRGEDGRLHALRELVEPVEVDALAAHHHRNGVRTTTLMGMVEQGSGETATSLAKRIEAELLPEYRALEPGLRVSIGGEATKTGETLGEMPLVLGLALLGIIMVVMLLTGSLTQALFVVSAVPLGLIGVVWAYATHGIPISLFALLGVTGLSGVVVNDSIVMVTSLNRTGHGEGGELHELVDEIATIAAERLRPVLLTTLTTVAGVMPTAYGFGGADAMLSPMSLAMGYGLIFATSITLLLVPSLYLIRRKGERRRARRRAAREG
ncbi:efflux RND transporter permease subunit [Pseudenhygromyxa sp. WMMC2535]|uniref:efflux RND transporter permease subunit n=1 Tax=Pseudenhygromyxa sp. WMMC2535 TaxID=2712867 RepID=UPI001555C383|nr:efflux RND transporter permease subunit [Pseudenhygromyxa sp. WMMC2535]NVB39702.1 efflux RND transporter permease subunit [Pseudenhygromyxa sp. WMMC2535]